MKKILMRKLFLGIFLTALLVLLVACAPNATIIKMQDKQYSIDIQNRLSGRTAMTVKFNEAARKQCNGKFKLITQQYVPNPDGSDHLIGVIECK
jgi:hypothetical protein